jgi:hypothetical protein
MLRLMRDSGLADRFRAYKVILDGNAIGEIKDGEKREFDVPSGRHQLYLKLDWCRSNIVVFETHENTVEFECGSNLRGIKFFLGIVYATFLYNRYIWLKQKQ